MFTTPPATRKMVNTRSMLNKQEKSNLLNVGRLNQHQEIRIEASKSDSAAIMPLKETMFKSVGGLEKVKSEDILLQPSTSANRNNKNDVVSTPKPRSKSSASSLARKKKLELEAAQEKARIQMELIEKKLAADMAEIDDKYSSRSEGSEVSTQSKVEKWIDRSQQELREQPSPRDGVTSGAVCSSRLPALDEGREVNMNTLVSAIKDLAAATTSIATKGADSKMLSRLCTPRDLPSFSGDALEWLQFKQAYQESTIVCNFTEKENLWRLRKCLHGSAKDAVMSLLISATTPDVIMSTLELQFGNPDVIISKIMQDITSLQPLSEQYHKDIIPFSVKVKNYVAAVQAISENEYLSAMNIVSIILSKLPTILISKWADFSYPYFSQGCKSKLVILSEFLDGEAVKISRTAVNLMYNQSEHSVQCKNNNKNRVQAVLVQTNYNSDNMCRFCRVSKHKLSDCKKFKKALRKDRWFFVKRYRLCYKCLVYNHNNENCSAPACDVDQCGQSHHRLLHYVPNNRTQQQNSVNITEVRDSVCEDSDLPVETISHINVNISKVLLKTVPITIHGPNGTVCCYALLDDGSTISLISGSLAARVGLQGQKQTLRVCGAWNSTDLVCDSEIVDMKVSNKDGTMFTLRARCVNELNLPVQQLSQINHANFEWLPEIKQYLCDDRMKPEILIGQDNYHLMLPSKIINGSCGKLYATCTPLGWCVHGCIHDPLQVTDRSSGAVHSALLISNAAAVTSDTENSLRELHEIVRRSFTIESLGIGCNPRQNADDERAIQHLEQTSTLLNGRWYVGLPWKEQNCKLPNSYYNAEHRLRGVMKKMTANEGFSLRYKDRINHLLQNDYATEITNPIVTPKTWYLPHFGVDNPNKKKLRLVFDAAAKSDGSCLNDFLLTGPDLLVSLYGILLRFREYKIAITGDIRDMFLRVKILPEDRDALRFLWKPTLDSEIKIFTMKSLIFGANCAPFIAQFIKNKNARRYSSSKPAAVEAIYKQHYMDDYIDSISCENVAIAQAIDIANIHKEGGFDIRNWTSNSEALINSLPKEALGNTAISFKIGQQYDGERTLGLIWFPKEDMLGFDLSLKRIPTKIITGEKRPTKREMLRVIMSIFDVYGFLAPFTIKGKIMLQETWKINLGWGEIIPDDIFIKWTQWLQMLKNINEIRLPRYYNNACKKRTEDDPSTNALNNTTQSQYLLNSTCVDSRSSRTAASAADTACYSNLQLHMFSDASTKAMCVVAYWRWIDNNSGQIKVAFISSKCRVSPIKHVSVPRLELQAAVLAARLSSTIIKEHRLTVHKKYYWCDSATVLHWIRNNTRTYKAYIARRLGEIDEFTQTNEWRYIPTKLNVSDIGTREHCDLSVIENEWFHGPQFLYTDESTWPREISPLNLQDVDLECITTIYVDSENLPAVPDPEKFSSWLRLLKTTCRVLSFIDKCKKLTGEIDHTTMMMAERYLLKFAQMQSFPDDLANLKQNKGLNKNSRILTLTPFLDEYGILRVGGRIDAAPEISKDVKQPVILDGHHHISKLIVFHYHVKAAHGNQEMVVNELKQKYWIIRIRPTVKNVTSKCMLCRIKKSIPTPPRMGDLRKARMAHHQRPFTFCGLELFGPMEVTVCRRREKRYGVLFTCLTDRAIHIEIVTKLTSDALIMALRRMAARRGWPQHLYSDNGTNMRGADTELKKSVRELDQNVLRDEAVNYGTTWNFIPPASPHWGGAWERLIKSVKNALYSTLKERAPRDEVLSTLMAEVEQMVNSRPLTHVTVEPNTHESLTPNHFLLGSSSNLPTLGEFGECEMYLRKQWRMAQRLSDLYWRRWVREVLPEMRPRTKWLREERPLQMGDLVLIVDPASPRNIWPKGLVQAVMPGKDGRVRVVDVKTQYGVLRRSAARVARIPTGDEC